MKRRRLWELAHLRVNDGMTNGMADVDGTLVAVGGIVIAARNAPLAELVGQVRETLARIQHELPPGTGIETVYDRLEARA